VDARGSGTVGATPDEELVERATQAEEVETKKEKIHELEALHPIRCHIHHESALQCSKSQHDAKAA
jgi:hypothetical protein